MSNMEVDRSPRPLHESRAILEDDILKKSDPDHFKHKVQPDASQKPFSYHSPDKPDVSNKDPDERPPFNPPIKLIPIDEESDSDTEPVMNGQKEENDIPRDNPLNNNTKGRNANKEPGPLMVPIVSMDDEFDSDLDEEDEEETPSDPPTTFIAVPKQNDDVKPQSDSDSSRDSGLIPSSGDEDSFNENSDLKPRGYSMSPSPPPLEKPTEIDSDPEELSAPELLEDEVKSNEESKSPDLEKDQWPEETPEPKYIPKPSLVVHNKPNSPPQVEDPISNDEPDGGQPKPVSDEPSEVQYRPQTPTENKDLEAQIIPPPIKVPESEPEPCKEEQPQQDTDPNSPKTPPVHIEPITPKKKKVPTATLR